MNVTANKPQYVTPLAGEVQWGRAGGNESPEVPQSLPPIKLAILWLNAAGQRCEGLVHIVTPTTADVVSLINWDNVITYVPTLS